MMASDAFLNNIQAECEKSRENTISSQPAPTGLPGFNPSLSPSPSLSQSHPSFPPTCHSIPPLFLPSFFLPTERASASVVPAPSLAAFRYICIMIVIIDHSGPDSDSTTRRHEAESQAQHWQRHSYSHTRMPMQFSIKWKELIESETSTELGGGPSSSSSNSPPCETSQALHPSARFPSPSLSFTLFRFLFSMFFQSQALVRVGNCVTRNFLNHYNCILGSKWNPVGAIKVKKWGEAFL